MIPKLLYTIPEAAELLSMYPQTLRKHISAGHIATVKHGNVRKILHKELEAFASKDVPTVWTNSRDGSRERARAEARRAS